MYEAIRSNDIIGTYNNLETALRAVDEDAQNCFCYLSCVKPIIVNDKIVRYAFLDMNNHPTIWEILVR